MATDPSTYSSEPGFRKLFEDYKNRVFGYVLTITNSHHQAEEITQELFIKLWTSRDLLPQVENLDQYILVMARHRTFNYLRKSLADQKGLDEIYNRMQDKSQNTEDRLIEAEYDQLLNRAVDQLSPQRKQVYELSRGGGLNIDEIAAQLNLSRNTVKNHLVEALKQIKEQLAKNGIGMLLLFIIAESFRA